LYQNQTTTTAPTINSIAINISIRISKAVKYANCMVKFVFAKLLYESEQDGRFMRFNTRLLTVAHGAPLRKRLSFF
jgi:hypothetical protein